MYCLLAVLVCSVKASDLTTQLSDSRIVEKGAADTADYRYLELDNGLKVLLISDPRVHLATASVSVGVGYFDDPITQAGSAHLLEHMLSKGSKEFPGAATYKQYLADHGGASNASTSSQHTNYYFYISPTNFEQALARFSAQFKTPLLLKSMIDKEKNAVNAEFKLKLKDTFRRKREVTRLTVNPLHPYRKFSTGNLNTLQDRQQVTLHHTISTLFQRFYVANNMTLVLQSKHSLRQLEKFASKHFGQLSKSPMIKKNGTRRALPKPFNAIKNSKLILIKTISNKRRITMSFKVDSALTTSGRSKSSFLKWLVENETHNGLKNTLFEQELIHDLETDYFKLDHNYDFFEIEFRLTKHGIEKADKIISRTLSYLEFLKAKANNKEQYSIFKELKDLAFEQNEAPHSRQYIRTLANRLFSISPEKILTHTGKADDFDKNKLENFFNALTPDNLSVTVLSKKFGLKNIEPIYQTEYAIKDLKWDKESANYINFSLPTRSRFLKKAHATSPLTNNDEHTDKSNSSSSLHIPGTNLSSAFRSTTINFTSQIVKPLDQSTRNWVLFELMLSRFDEQLENLRRQATNALIDLYLVEEKSGFSITISSFQDNHQTLVEEAIDTILNQPLNDNLINSSYTLLKSSYRTNQSERLRKKISRRFKQTLGLRPSNSKAYNQLEKTLEKHYRRFVDRFFGASNTSILFYGNISESSQAESQSILVEKLSRDLSNPETSEKPLYERIAARLKNRSGRQSFDFKHPDNAVREVRMMTEQTSLSVAKVMLLGHLIKAPFFHQLRTEKQLGYTVSASAQNILGVEYLNFYVQSPDTNSNEILNHIYTFNRDFMETLSRLDKTEFEQRKLDMLAKIRARTQTEEQKFNLLKRHHNWGLDHQFNQQVIEQIEALSLAQFLTFARAFLDEKYPYKISILTE